MKKYVLLFFFIFFIGLSGAEPMYDISESGGGGDTYTNITNYNNYTIINGSSYNSTYDAKPSGSGTPNQLPKWATANSLGDSLLSDNSNGITLTTDKYLQLPCSGTGTFATTGKGLEFSCYSGDSYIQNYNRGAGAWTNDTYIRAGEVHIGSYRSGSNTTFDTSAKFNSYAYFSQPITVSDFRANINQPYYSGTLTHYINGQPRYQWITGDGTATISASNWYYLRAWNYSGSYINDDTLKINAVEQVASIFDTATPSGYALTIAGRGLRVKNVSTFDMNITAPNICYSNGTGCLATGGGNSSWNQSYADTLYAPIGVSSMDYTNVLMSNITNDVANITNINTTKLTFQWNNNDGIWVNSVPRYEQVVQFTADSYAVMKGTNGWKLDSTLQVNSGQMLRSDDWESNSLLISGQSNEIKTNNNLTFNNNILNINGNLTAIKIEANNICYSNGTGCPTSGSGDGFDLDNMTINYCKGLVIFEPFINNDAIETGEVGQYGWHYSGQGTSASAQTTAPSFGNINGLIRLNTGSTAVGNISLVQSITQTFLDGYTGNITAEWRVTRNAVNGEANNWSEFIGLHDAVSGTIRPVDGFYFMYNNTEKNWSIGVSANSVRNITITNIPVNYSYGSYNVFQRLGIKILNESGTYKAYYYINGNHVGTFSNGLPLGSARAFGAVASMKKHAGTTQTLTYLDYFYYKQEFQVPRC